MRRAIGQSLRIGVASHAVSLLRASRWRGAPATLLAEQALASGAEHPFDAIGNALRALLAEESLAGWPVSFVLADELVRMWRVAPPAGAVRMADIEAAAGLRFQSLYGEAPAAWRIAADWDAAQPFFAAAVPRALLATLELVAQQQQLAIVAIEPHFVAAYNRWRRTLKPGAWFGLVHDNLLTVAAIGGADQPGLLALRSMPLPHGADQYWLGQTLAREALLLNTETPPLLQVCGAAPEAWSRPVGSPAHIPCIALDQVRRGDSAGWSTAALLARAGSAA